MTQMFKEMGKCTSKGSTLMQELFGVRKSANGDEDDKELARFSFQGLLGQPGRGHRRAWSGLAEVCQTVPNPAHFQKYGSTAAELLANTGACLAQSGHTFEVTAGHRGIITSSAPRRLLLDILHTTSTEAGQCSLPEDEV